MKPVIINRLDDLPFDFVKELYCQRIFSDATNDIKERTRLLAKYPELFDSEVWAELEEVFKKVINYQRRRRLIHLNKRKQNYDKE
jgi:hypothetical protein